MLAADGLLEEGLVDLLEDGEHVLVGYFLYLVQDLLVPLLGNHPLLGVAVAVAKAEELLEDHLQLQLRAPAEILGKGQGRAVAVVDLGKHVSIGGIDDVPAQHPGEGIAGQHGALAGAAAGDNVVGRAAVEQDAGQQPALHIGQLAGIVGGIHAVVDHLVAHGFHNLAQAGFNHAVLGRLTVFIQKRDFHGNHPFLRCHGAEIYT